MKVLISPLPCQHLWSGFVILAIRVGVKWHLIVVSICVSQLANDAEHLLMCFLADCISSLEKRLFRFFAHFKTGLLVFYYWVIIFNRYKFQSDIGLENLFPISVGCLFTRHDVLWSTNIFNFDDVAILQLRHLIGSWVCKPGVQRRGGDWRYACENYPCVDSS